MLGSRKHIALAPVAGPPRSWAQVLDKIKSEWTKLNLSSVNSNFYMSFFQMMKIVSEEMGYSVRVVKVIEDDSDSSIKGHAFYEVFVPPQKSSWLKAFQQSVQSREIYKNIQQQMEASRSNFGVVRSQMMHIQAEKELELTPANQSYWRRG